MTASFYVVAARIQFYLQKLNVQCDRGDVLRQKESQVGVRLDQ